MKTIKKTWISSYPLVSCILSLFKGGDSTFLQAAGYLDNSKIPILGINSDPTRRTGFLTNVGIEHMFMKKQVKLIMDMLNSGVNIEYFYRTRGLFEISDPVTGMMTQKLCLNEVFAAEKDVSTTSMYRLQVDGNDMGRFKSSGIIISTGTGSSGWLHSARQVTYHDV